MAGGAAPRRKGDEFERRVRDELAAIDYEVMRSPASGGVLDLLAVRWVPAGEVLFIQCKRGGACDRTAWNALFVKAQERGAVPLVACRRLREPTRYYRLVMLKSEKSRRNPWEPYEP